MKPLIALSALLITGFVAASTEQASAVVYCQYIAYPAGCVIRLGVLLRARPVARAAVATPGGCPGCWSAGWNADESWRTGPSRRQVGHISDQAGGWGRSCTVI